MQAEQPAREPPRDGTAQRRTTAPAIWVAAAFAVARVMDAAEERTADVKLYALICLLPFSREASATPSHGGSAEGRSIQAMAVPPCRRPNRVKRLVAFLRRRSPAYAPFDWPEEPPPDIGVREPRRPRPGSGSGSVLLDPPL